MIAPSTPRRFMMAGSGDRIQRGSIHKALPNPTTFSRRDGLIEIVLTDGVTLQVGAHVAATPKYRPHGLIIPCRAITAIKPCAVSTALIPRWPSGQQHNCLTISTKPP
jgi:hypothetical protein